MTAIWVLLGLAVLLGGVILGVIVYAVRHDGSAGKAAADTEVGRSSRESGTAHGPEAAGRPLAQGRAVPAGRDGGVTA